MTITASRNSLPQPSSVPRRIVIWDLPIRAFHWVVAVLVVFSYVAGKVGGGWMEWHLRSGYAILALLVFRLAWGVAGSANARFVHFVRGPKAAMEYVASLRSGRVPVLAGHNPLGGWMVLFLLAILAAQVGTGLFADDEIATQGPLAAKVSEALVARMTALHSLNSWIIAGAVAFHVAAVLFYQWKIGIDLIGPMVRGWREAADGIAIQEPKRAPLLLAIVLLAAAAAAVYLLVVIYPRGGAAA